MSVVSRILLPAGESADQMVPAVEVLNPTFALRAPIRNGEITRVKGSMETSVRDGCTPMKTAIENLHKEKKITGATMKTALGFFR